MLYLIAFAAIGWLCFKVGDFLIKAAHAVKEDQKKKAFYQEQLLSSVQTISGAVNPPESKPDPVEQLLAANQELIKKESLEKAMREELGIK